MEVEVYRRTSKKVCDWTKFGDEHEQLRHQGRLRIKENAAVGSSYKKSMENMGRLCVLLLVGWDRRVYASQWYEGLRPGRFFLFYQENKIIQRKKQRFKKGLVKMGITSQDHVFDWGPLRTIDRGSSMY